MQGAANQFKKIHKSLPPQYQINLLISKQSIRKRKDFDIFILAEKILHRKFQRKKETNMNEENFQLWLTGEAIEVFYKIYSKLLVNTKATKRHLLIQRPFKEPISMEKNRDKKIVTILPFNWVENNWRTIESRQ